jgi:FtsP/CotA-like multicopper oxidase with cupredoxin domain
VEPVSRRTALTLGGLGLLGTVVGGAGVLWTASRTRSGEPFAEPASIASANGRLEVRLEAARNRVQIGGRAVDALGYNGGIPGPTLRIAPGDTLAVSLQNRLDAPTNLHVHGLHVSPQGHGDNPFVTIEAGASFDYEYRVPRDHPPGLYWYHPHHHGLVADQLFGGLYGAIVIEEPDPIEVANERLLVISDITVDAWGGIPRVSAMEQMSGREGALVLVNGLLSPHLTTQPGERERWRIVNACVSRYLRLRLDGQQLLLLGRDGGRLGRAESIDELLLAPGNRADLLVTMATGDSVLRGLAYDRGNADGMMGGPGSSSSNDVVTLATLTVAGETVPAAPDLAAPPQPRDLREAAVAAERELVFAMGMGGPAMMSFTIDGREFDPDRVDTVVEAGSVEEWTLTNTSPMDHPVHLHVWPMQIIDAPGVDADAVIWQDVVNVPARSRVRVRIAFDDFTGRSVYHCHILDHEDRGMMGVIEVS